ncbi:glycosyltransferase family 4 protein [Paludisphaera soli]|uniref:glycosyltransferase family 4 protein n=1 Tax=Paludisphaera soli TaxID=2712865 RepID=UPI0013EA0D53|nr:glycosyltransferase family 4 protein [Paludisphaera soli]
MASRPSPESPHHQTDVRAVGFLVPGWPPEGISNGIVSYTRNLRRSLRERGVDVHLVAAGWYAEGPVADVEGVHRLPPMDGPSASLARRGLRWAQRRVRAWDDAARRRQIGRGLARIVDRLRREHGLQLFQMEESFGWASEVIGRCDVPVVVRLHGPWFLNGTFGPSASPDDVRRIRREGRAIAAAAGVSSPSRDVLDRTRDRYGLALADARAIPIPMEAPPESDRWSLAGCDRDRILFVGRFDLHKGGDLVVEAFRRVLDRRPQARLTFAGADRGVETAGGVRRLRPFVDERLPGALDDGRIEWLGRVPPAVLDAQRRRALTTIVPSRYETFGNTLREAMILGCPVVSSDAGGLGEILDDGRNALAVPPGDADALARAILRLLDDPEAAAALGARAAEDCASRYDPDRIVAETLDFYGEVIARHAAARR